MWPCGSWMNLKNCQHFLCLQRVSRTELFVESQRHLVLRKNMPATHALHTTRKVSIWFHTFPIPTSHVSDLSIIGVSQTRPLSQWPGLRNSNSALRLMYNLKIILNLLLLNWDLWNGMEIMWPFAVEKRVIFFIDEWQQQHWPNTAIDQLQARKPRWQTKHRLYVSSSDNI